MGYKFFLIIFFLFVFKGVYGQLTPQQAVSGMMRGINIGNTMDAPDGESTWGNIPIQQRAFSDYKNAGFTAVRIPITWDKRTAATSPYTVSPTWMDRVEQVVNWGLSQNLIIIINAHHEDWIKTNYTATNIARFDSLWSQIASRFKNKSDSLIFEIINEPHPMVKANVDNLNKRVLQIIRRTNPSRIVAFSGDYWSGANDLINAAIPDAADPYIMGYYHSYDPYLFGLEGKGTYGSDTDLNNTKLQFDDVLNWWTYNNIPVFLGEFGAINKCEYNSRMTSYASFVYQSLAHGIPAFAWDDGGDFKIYNRNTGGYNEIKDILIYTQLESPYKFTQSVVQGTRYISLSWVNRALTDSIIIERAANTATGFVAIAKVAPTSQQFTDSTVIAGNIYYYRLRTTVPDKIVMSYPIRTAKICEPVNITPYFKIGTNPIQESSNVAMKVGDTVLFSPVAAVAGGTWSWAGPNSFASTSREITLSNIQKAAAGNYAATYTVMSGCPNIATFVVSVCEPVAVTPYLQISGKAQVQDSIAILNAGSGVRLLPLAASSGGTWSWTGPNGFSSTGSSVILTSIQESKAGIYQVSYSLTPVCVTKINYLVQLAVPNGLFSNESEKIGFFPNPTHGSIQIKGCSTCIVKIFDTSGNLLIETKIPMNTIFNTRLSSGFYLIRIESKNKIYVDKLIVK